MGSFVGKPKRTHVRTEGDSSVDEQLIIAASAGDVERVRTLLALSADVETSANRRKRHQGWTPLHHAVKGGHCDMVHELLDAGAEVNAKTDKGRTPLGIAIKAAHAGDGDIPSVLRAAGGQMADEGSMHDDWKQHAGACELGGLRRNQIFRVALVFMGREGA
jgi:ankyrin repeat protein